MSYATIIKTRAGTYVPGLGIVCIPTHIYRNNKKQYWRICDRNYPDIEDRYFKDSHYSSCGAALKDAINILQAYQEELTAGMPLLQYEKSNKVRKTEHAGIGYLIRAPKGKPRHHYFAIANPLTHRTKQLYIGTDNTYLARWDAKLREAEDIRHGFEREHSIHWYWRDLYTLPKEVKNKR